VFDGNIMVAYLEVTLVFSCVLASHACACPTHPLFFFPPMCFCSGVQELVSWEPFRRSVQPSMVAAELRCFVNMMDKIQTHS